MNSKRFSYLMILVVAAFCIGLISVVVAGNNIFKKQSDRLVEAKAKNEAIKDQEVSLIQAKKDIERYTELNEIAKSIVPQDKDQAKTIREINNIAASSGIKLQQITFATSNLGQASVAPKPASSEEGSSTPATPATPPVSQVKPVAGINNVYSLEITISSGDKNAVPYNRFLDFLKKLESNRRTAHVTNISVAPSEDNKSNVTFSLVLNAYLKIVP